MGTEQYNMMLFQTADDAWNAQDLKIFANRHTKDVIVHAPRSPTRSDWRLTPSLRSTPSRRSPNLGVRVHGQKKAD